MDALPAPGPANKSLAWCQQNTTRACQQPSAWPWFPNFLNPENLLPPQKRSRSRPTVSRNYPVTNLSCIFLLKRKHRHSKGTFQKMSFKNHQTFEQLLLWSQLPAQLLCFAAMDFVVPSAGRCASLQDADLILQARP